MAINKQSIFIGLAVSGAFAAASHFVTFKEVPPPTIAQCEAASEVAYLDYIHETQGNPTDKQRREYLGTLAQREACIDKSKAGPSLVLALK